QPYYPLSLFFSKDKLTHSIHQQMFNQYFQTEPFKLIPYTHLPVHTPPIPQHLPHTIPYIQQLFLHITPLKQLQKPFFLPTKQIQKYTQTQS
ncbi:hypothetical protein, partial [Staphylococcus epidermidis]|uniref:hypothetical protein n=1 Tax=Staphylococcus epidermidis TaxID=1282 RepID=UPI001C930CD5